MGHRAAGTAGFVGRMPELDLLWARYDVAAGSDPQVDGDRRFPEESAGGRGWSSSSWPG